MRRTPRHAHRAATRRVTAEQFLREDVNRIFRDNGTRTTLDYQTHANPAGVHPEPGRARQSQMRACATRTHDWTGHPARAVRLVLTPEGAVPQRVHRRNGQNLRRAVDAMLVVAETRRSGDT
ncbi:hypothetical protein GALL_459810 [mine drainage metagenome]|uniref:Uncharacterized protein n=1 Tax=mine drainage metagenome TaxID=410659 RepID=A0A1J5PNM0_9ZZZZ